MDPTLKEEATLKEELTLREFRLKSCDRFIQKLLETKESLKGTDLTSSLSDLHTSFLVLVNSFKIPPIQPENEIPQRTALQSNRKVEKIKIHKITLLVFDEVVIDLEDSHEELAYLFVNQPVEKAVQLARLFVDYETRPCDFCGSYFLEPEFETPERRRKMKDFVLSYHSACESTSSSRMI